MLTFHGCEKDLAGALQSHVEVSFSLSKKGIVVERYFEDKMYFLLHHILLKLDVTMYRNIKFQKNNMYIVNIFILR